jgi:uncharacterized protein with HEPN domain
LNKKNFIQNETLIRAFVRSIEIIGEASKKIPEEVKQVSLKVNSSPEEKSSRGVVIKPIRDESNLYYFDWVQTNIKKVNKAKKGKVGYIHVPDMGVYGLNEFVKNFTRSCVKKH